MIQHVKPPVGVPLSQSECWVSLGHFTYGPGTWMVMLLEKERWWIKFSSSYHPCGIPGWNSWLLALGWALPSNCGHLRSGLVHRRLNCLCFSTNESKDLPLHWMFSIKIYIRILKLFFQITKKYKDRQIHSRMDYWVQEFLLKLSQQLTTHKRIYWILVPIIPLL